MTGGKYDRTSESPSVVSFYAYNLVFFYYDGIHPGLEVNLTATFQDGISHVLNYSRKLVCSDVRMSIYKN